jgi:hypothetical protein
MVAASKTVVAIAGVHGKRCFGHHKSKLITAISPIVTPVKASGADLMFEGPFRKSGRTPLTGAVVAIVTVTRVDDVPFSKTEL